MMVMRDSEVSTLRLHLGCGRRHLAGYVHIDLADYPHIAYRNEVSQLPMFEDNTVDLIYASHVMEYFDRVQVMAVLAEWRRVLRPEGVLRLAVPDFEAMVQVYNRQKDLSLIVGPLYGRWLVPGSDRIIYHKTVYDFAAIGHVLQTAGFRGVERWDWRQVFVGEHAGYDDYSQAYIPHMDKVDGILISLNVQARK